MGQDHMEIGSGLLQLIIARLIKKAINKKIGKQVKMSVVFNSPLVFNNDGDNVEIKVDAKVKMPMYDFKEFIDTLI